MFLSAAVNSVTGLADAGNTGYDSEVKSPLRVQHAQKRCYINCLSEIIALFSIQIKRKGQTRSSWTVGVVHDVVELVSRLRENVRPIPALWHGQVSSVSGLACTKK